ncbi:MAG: DUF5597 domain-containing protein [Terriglobia bacterium]
MISVALVSLALLSLPSRGNGQVAVSVPVSTNLAPHLETAGGRKLLFVDGLPFTALAVEIPWDQLLYGRYQETLHAYDYLYPAAEAMGLNSLKVPVKWSMVEPQKGVFDFTYIDHAKSLAEKHHLKLILNWFGHYASGNGNIYLNLSGQVFAPMDIIEDAERYPRAIDADGIPHHAAISYEYDAVIQREIAAFRAFMKHIRDVDSQTRTIIMIQVENEIAVFGWERQNRKYWRDHSPIADKLFAEKGFTDDLKYSAWRLSTNWLRPLTDAGAEVYPLPFFLNYVGGVIRDWMVGGAPGEDVATYLENCPAISFVGLNLYLPPESSTSDFRSALARYQVSRNLPSITETNSARDPVAPRLAYIAVGEFGSPIFAPWALSDSYPVPYQPYVLPDGSLANGAPALRDTYLSLRAALPQIATYAGTEKLKVFMSRLPGERFSETRDVNGAKVVVSGEGNGQAIVIHPTPNEFILVGYRCEVTLTDDAFQWPGVRQVRVERGRYVGREWKGEGDPLSFYGVNTEARTVEVPLMIPQVVRVHW